MALPAGLQFHTNGCRGSGDPRVLQFSGHEPDFQAGLPSEVDVLIVGAGPAGHLLGAQLAQFPDITTRIVEPRPGRLEWGQADGLHCRTVEMFEAFGFSERVLKEAYWVNETTFWSPGEDGTGLARTGRVRDTEEGLSEFPHVVLNQARMQDLWLDAMKWSPTRLEPTYSTRLVALTLPTGGEPVHVTVERTDDARRGQRQTLRAKYVVGCDGARSTVRQSLGLAMRGDWTNQVWGVMDALLLTDFPDIRLKTVIHSAHDGSIQIIPREGGHLVRFYIELDRVSPDSRVEYRQKVTPEMLVERAQRIFRPYSLDVREIAYWSVYEVGQRLADHFDDVPAHEKAARAPRIFIAGDACHTHSAKAGQGMNVSMHDAFNLGWKLMHVLRGLSPARLLHTYSEERRRIARQLIDFDRQFARVFAARPKKGAARDEAGVVDPEVFQAYFTAQARYMAGLATEYPDGMLISAASRPYQGLATGYTIGTRFPSDPVVRAADAKPVQLGHVMDADGRWRVVLFADARHHPTAPDSPLAHTCAFLHSHLLPAVTPRGHDRDSVIDVRAVLPHPRHTFAVTDLPPLLLPHTGALGLRDYEKAFTDEEGYGCGAGRGHLFRTRHLDPDRGCILLVRPDQHIAAVLPLASPAHALLIEFFAACMNLSESADPDPPHTSTPTAPAASSSSLPTSTSPPRSPSPRPPTLSSCTAVRAS